MRRMRTSDLNQEQVLREAVSILTSGGIVAYPTETFYGLGVKYDLENSLERLYVVKGRPREKALPLVIGDRGLLYSLADSVSITAQSIMEGFWPGPLTLLFRAKRGLSRYITADTGKVAVRIPGVSFALDLARETGFPITATSANPSGMPPARDAESVEAYFGNTIDLLINAGPTNGRLPSTIVDATAEILEIVREGAISKEALLEKHPYPIHE